jgi:glycine oxidase
VANTADVIVVGAGIIGCAIARELARRGARVRVFEARAVGAGATQASAGVLAPYIEAPRPGPLLDLAVRSLGMYDRFVEELQDESRVDVEFRRSGTLEVALDVNAATQLRAGMADIPSHAGAQWLAAAETRALERSLPESVLGAVHVSVHAYVAATQLTEALTWAALRHGVQFEAGRRVAAIRGGGDAVEVRAHDGQTWSGDAVILATGSWTGQVDADLHSLRAVRPVRGQLLRLSWRGEPLRHVIWGPDCYVVPWNDGTVLVGATVEDVGFDERTTAAGVRDLLDAVCELLPLAWGATFLEARVGLRPATDDGLPVIGPLDAEPRILYATGHYRNGILLAPVTASIVAEWLIDGHADEALAALKPDRFRHRGQAP